MTGTTAASVAGAQPFPGDPEVTRELVREHKSAVRKSKIEAAVVLGAIGVGAFLAVRALRDRSPSQTIAERNEVPAESPLARRDDLRA